MTFSVLPPTAEEAKNLPWTRPQAWKIVSSLAKRGEVRPVYSVIF